MIIPIHSNIVSGLYVILFETLLPLILCVALQTYIYAHNLHVIHNCKSPLRLSTTRLSIVASFGITSKRNARLTSLLGCAALILTIMGSFSIDGASRMATNVVTMPLFVSVANTSSDVIDFTKHVSSDGLRMSATFLLALEAVGCFRRNETDVLMYPSVAYLDNVGDIDSVIHSYRSLNFNISCALEQESFVRIPHYSESIQNYGIADNRCSFNTSLTVRNSSLWQESSAVGCSEFETVETWCASFQYFTCVTHIRTDTRHSFMFLVPTLVGTQGNPVLTALHRSSSRAIPSQMVKSAAYLMATGVGRLEVIEVSKMSIKRSVPVEVEAGEVFETEVSVPLFLCTVGVATVATLIVFLATLLKWRQHVVKQGLRGKNGFNGAMDVILLAAELGEDEEEVAAHDDVVVGVSAGEPRVGPVLKTRLGGTEFYEQGVQGRLRRRNNELVLRAEEVDTECKA